MFAIIIMLLVLIEVIFSGILILFFIKSRKNILKINKEITLIKKEIINVIADYRISVRMLNQQIKGIKLERKTKQILDFLNLLAGVSLCIGIKKKKLSIR